MYEIFPSARMHAVSWSVILRNTLPGGLVAWWLGGAEQPRRNWTLNDQFY